MEWSEAWVRQQADWKAFKRGQELAETLAPPRRRGNILSGVITQGRRKLRCVARNEDGHLTVECGCVANRTTGEICEHAVALVLAALARSTTAGQPAEPSGDPPAEPPTAPAVPVRAYRIRLPRRCGEMLAAGRLRLRLEPADVPVEEADRRFAAFLDGHGVRSSDALLDLDGGRRSGALAALAGHPRISTEDDRPVRVVAGALDPLPLAGSELRQDRVALELAPADVRIFEFDGHAAARVASEGGLWIGRLPVEVPSDTWRSRLDELCRHGRIEIGRREFLAEIEAWLDVLASPAAGWLGSLRFEAARPCLRVRIEGSFSALQATVEMHYGDGHFESDPDRAAAGLPRLEDGRLRVRSRDQEALPARILERTGWQLLETGGFRLHDSDAVPLWLGDELPELRRHTDVVLGERLRNLIDRLHVVSPHIELATGGSLACELSFQTGDGKRLDPVKLRALMRRGERSLQTRDGGMVVIRREFAEVVEPLLADLGIVTPEQRFTITKAQQILFRDFHKNQGNRLETNRLENQESDVSNDLIRGRLRPYQEIGVRWLFERIRELSGALLGDEMGLGKTIQTIALIQMMKRSDEATRVLLLTPTSLIGNWERELGEFAPDLRLCRFMGRGRDGIRDEAAGAEVLLTSYGTFQRDRAFHLGRRYDLVVCDEASLLRNPDGQLSRAVAKLDAAGRLALSGTPVENRLEDLWALFRFVAPGYLGSRKDFAERYGGDAPGARRRLALRISPYYLRRTKDEVAPELPDKLVVDEWLDLDGPARELYSAVARAGLERLESCGSAGAARMHLLTVLLRLRQICLSPRLVDEDHRGEAVKVAWVRQLLEERHETGGKTLVFSQFAGFLRDLESHGELTADHRFRLDGSTRDRGGLVREFQECRGSAVFLISLKAGGYGLNLTAADAVVHLDPWWNPAVENQATDRAHRIGQTRPVSVFRLLARDTVEERVRRIQGRKRVLMDVTEGGGSEDPGGDWSERDLRELLG